MAQKAQELFEQWDARIQVIVDRFHLERTERLHSMNAVISHGANGDMILRSYDTDVAFYVNNDMDGEAVYCPNYMCPDSWGGWRERSSTTERQISRFIKEYCPNAIRYNLYVPNSRIIMTWIGDTQPLKVDKQGYVYYIDDNGLKHY